MRLFLSFLIIVFLSCAVDAQDHQAYETATYKNLSYLTWKFGLYDLKNNDAIDGTLVIQHCELHHKYRQNEFLWQRIREGQRRDLEQFANDLPSSLTIRALMALGAYDFDKAAFILPKEYALDNAGSIKIPLEWGAGDVCMENRNNTLFPQNMKFIADNRFALKEIPMPPDQAKELIEALKQYEYKDITNAGRVVPILFNVRIQDVEKGKQNDLIFKGQLDNISIYEDPYLEKKIWTRSFTD